MINLCDCVCSCISDNVENQLNKIFNEQLNISVGLACSGLSNESCWIGANTDELVSRSGKSIAFYQLPKFFIFRVCLVLIYL